MTRKDYELIASRIKDARESARRNDRMNHDARGEAGEIIYDLALALSEDFKRDNPNFQPERFLTACGMTL